MASRAQTQTTPSSKPRAGKREGGAPQGAGSAGQPAQYAPNARGRRQARRQAERAAELARAAQERVAAELSEYLVPSRAQRKRGVTAAQLREVHKQAPEPLRVGPAGHAKKTGKAAVWDGQFQHARTVRCPQCGSRACVFQRSRADPVVAQVKCGRCNRRTVAQVPTGLGGEARQQTRSAPPAMALPTRTRTQRRRDARRRRRESASPPPNRRSGTYTIGRGDHRGLPDADATLRHRPEPIAPPRDLPAAPLPSGDAWRVKGRAYSLGQLDRRLRGQPPLPKAVRRPTPAGTYVPGTSAKVDVAIQAAAEGKPTPYRPTAIGVLDRVKARNSRDVVDQDLFWYLVGKAAYQHRDAALRLTLRREGEAWQREHRAGQEQRLKTKALLLAVDAAMVPTWDEQTGRQFLKGSVNNKLMEKASAAASNDLGKVGPWGWFGRRRLHPPPKKA